MSDFDEELLSLLERGSEKKPRSKKDKSSKKRKAAEVSDYEEPESEEDVVDPYPIEGKYASEADRQRLMQMSEIEREEILSSRAEERQKTVDRQAIRRMIQQRNDDGAGKSAKRQRGPVGATKEKTNKLDELKAKRQAKGSRKPTESSHRHNESDMETGTSDEEEEGQVTKRAPSPNVDAPATLEELNKCRVTRDKIVRYFLAPWFQEYIQHGWVRYCIGADNQKNIYRACQVISLTEGVKPYKVEQVSFDKNFELQHGKSAKVWPMDKVSNSPFDLSEYERLRKSCESDGIKFPTSKEIQSQIVHMEKLASQAMTESDINALLKRKSEIRDAGGIKTQGWVTLERARLNQVRTMALRRKDFKEMEMLDEEIAQFSLLYGEEVTLRKENDTLAALSAKNRKANAEAVRRAEIAAHRERKLNKNVTSDPSARLKTSIRTSIRTSAAPSRSGTPLSAPETNGGVKTPVPAAINTGLSKSFEASIVNSVDVDLGDF